MRIHLPLEPHHFVPQPTAGPSSSPLVSIGGDLVLIELQGELSWEGEKHNGVVGVLGFDRPDKPTLHLGQHHLLHGKISTLQKPYAVIRRAVGAPAAIGTTLEGDQSDEEDIEVDEIAPAKRPKGKGKAQPGKSGEEEDDEPEPPLFEPEPSIFPNTPSKQNKELASSSPFMPDGTPMDYSSELDPSSPARGWGSDKEGDEDGESDGEERRREEEYERRKKSKAKRKREQADRTRHYEVVGIVRKKVVFALRPEPIVTATILPE